MEKDFVISPLQVGKFNTNLQRTNYEIVSCCVLLCIRKDDITLEQSKLYHESKSKEFTRHTAKGKQPNFTYPHTEVSYTNDFSSESYEK